MKTNLSQTVVVNGTPVIIETDIFTPLTTIIAAALREAKYTHLPPENWDIKDAEGNIFPVRWEVGKARQSVNPAAIHADKFFLTLRAGVGA